MLEITWLLDLRPLLDHLVVDRDSHQLTAQVLLKPDWQLFAFDERRVSLRLVSVSIDGKDGRL